MLADIFPRQKSPRIVMQYNNQTMCYHKPKLQSLVMSSTFTWATEDVIRQNVCIPEPWWCCIPCIHDSKWNPQFMQKHLQDQSKEWKVEFVPLTPKGKQPPVRWFPDFMWSHYVNAIVCCLACWLTRVCDETGEAPGTMDFTTNRTFTARCKTKSPQKSSQGTLYCKVKILQNYINIYNHIELCRKYNKSKIFMKC